MGGGNPIDTALFLSYVQYISREHKKRMQDYIQQCITLYDPAISKIIHGHGKGDHREIVDDINRMESLRQRIAKGAPEVEKMRVHTRKLLDAWREERQKSDPWKCWQAWEFVSFYYLYDNTIEQLGRDNKLTKNTVMEILKESVASFSEYIESQNIAIEKYIPKELIPASRQ